MDTNLKNELNFLAKPLMFLGIVTVLILVALIFGIKQINSLRAKIAAGEKTQATLQQKVVTLESVNNVLAGDVTFLDIVLPSKGAVLYGLSQIKYQAFNQNIALSSLKTGISIPESGDVYKTAISFEAEGEEQALYAFLQSFSKVLPLMNVDKVSLNKSGTTTRASITISVYSSQLPTKIPAVTDAVKDFTKEETALLQTIATYSLPLFVEPSAPQTENLKTDPFQ